MTVSASRPEVPIEEYGEQYFKRYNYADRPLSRFSMYWFARRYYAALIRRYAPKDVPQAERRLRPLGRRRFRITRPARVAMRARKPCFRFRLRTFG